MELKYPLVCQFSWIFIINPYSIRNSIKKDFSLKIKILKNQTGKGQEIDIHFVKVNGHYVWKLLLKKNHVLC